MPRRASLPGADLLFGAPGQPRNRADRQPPNTPVPPASPPAQPVAASISEPGPAAGAAESGPPVAGSRPAAGGTRPRHDEKITFYCTDSDLTRLEAARLSLRANHRLATDRGRIVRAAIAEMLDDFDARGADSVLVKRLTSN